MATKALPENQRRRVELPAKMALLAVLGNAQLSLDAPKWLHLKETLQTLLGGVFPFKPCEWHSEGYHFHGPKNPQARYSGYPFRTQTKPQYAFFPPKRDAEVDRFLEPLALRAL